MSLYSIQLKWQW